MRFRFRPSGLRIFFSTKSCLHTYNIVLITHVFNNNCKQNECSPVPIRFINIGLRDFVLQTDPLTFIATHMLLIKRIRQSNWVLKCVIFAVFPEKERKSSRRAFGGGPGLGRADKIRSRLSCLRTNEPFPGVHGKIAAGLAP